MEIKGLEARFCGDGERSAKPSGGIGAIGGMSFDFYCLKEILW